MCVLWFGLPSERNTLLEGDWLGSLSRGRATHGDPTPGQLSLVASGVGSPNPDAHTANPAENYPARNSKTASQQNSKSTRQSQAEGKALQGGVRLKGRPCKAETGRREGPARRSQAEGKALQGGDRPKGRPCKAETGRRESPARRRQAEGKALQGGDRPRTATAKWDNEDQKRFSLKQLAASRRRRRLNSS